MLHLHKLRTNQYCEFCYENHSCRDCHKEKQLRTIISTKVGLLMEELIEHKLKCKYCNKYSLIRRGDNSPSLDLECRLCKKKIELKSKCMSVGNIPHDITCKGGNYFHLQNTCRIE